MLIDLLVFKTFDTNCDSEKQAMKVLEEAAELLAADKTDDGVLEEAMDVLQALANYIAIKGYTNKQLAKAQNNHVRKMYERGNYEDDDMSF